MKHTVAIAGQSILLNANAPEFRRDVRDARRLSRPRRQGPFGRRDREPPARPRSRTKIEDGLVNVFSGPPIDGLGTAGGFKMIVEDRGDSGMKALQDDGRQRRRRRPATRTGLKDVFTSFRANTPWLYLDIDRAAGQDDGRLDRRDLQHAAGLPRLAVRQRLQPVRPDVAGQRAGGAELPQPDRRHQADQDPQRAGEHGAAGNDDRHSQITGPVLMMRYNMYPAAAVNVTPAAGVSSGQAIEEAEAAAQAALPRSMQAEWTELALLQLANRQHGHARLSAGRGARVSGAGGAVRKLVPAAGRDSRGADVPACARSPACSLARMDINIFTQVGFVVLDRSGVQERHPDRRVRQVAKARPGTPPYVATLEACKLRLRPIMMTSFAFVLGVVPLVLAEGAGAEMRRTLGTAVFAGMLGVTLFGIFLTPVFYYVIRWLGERLSAVIRRLRPPTILRAIWPKPHPSRVLLKVEDGPYWLKRTANRRRWFGGPSVRLERPQHVGVFQSRLRLAATELMHPIEQAGSEALRVIKHVGKRSEQDEPLIFLNRPQGGDGQDSPASSTARRADREPPSVVSCR